MLLSHVDSDLPVLLDAVGDRRSVQNAPRGIRDPGEDAAHFAVVFVATVFASAISYAAETWQRRNRPIDDPQYLAERDLRGLPEQHVAAGLAATAGHDSVMLQVEQYLFQELPWDALPLG